MEITLWFTSGLFHFSSCAGRNCSTTLFSPTDTFFSNKTFSPPFFLPQMRQTTKNSSTNEEKSFSFLLRVQNFKECVTFIIHVIRAHERGYVCRLNFGLNVVCCFKRCASVGCQNNPFHGSYYYSKLFSPQSYPMFQLWTCFCFCLFVCFFFKVCLPTN